MFNDLSLTTLPDGCRVASVVLPNVESVSVGLWMGVGGRHERGAESGHSHFLEHMVFKGTDKRSARRISQEIEGRGGYLNAFTQQESTCYYARVPAKWTRLALDVLANMVCDPKLSPTDVERERSVILEEIGMYRDQPDAHVFDLAGEALWRKHPLGRSLTGTPETIRRVTQDSLDSFRRRYYTAPGTVVVAAGNVRHDVFLERVKPYAEALPKGSKPRFKPVGPSTSQTPLVVEFRDIEQAHMVLAFRGFGRRDPERYTLRILNVLLGENMSSRLFQSLRERHGLAYSVASSIQLHADSGALFIGAGLDPDRMPKALSLCVDELKRLQDRPPSSAELQRARDYVLGSLRLGLETPESQMSWLGETLSGHGQFLHPGETIAGIQAVTPEDVRTLARSYCQTGRASLALVMPRGSGNQGEHYRKTLDRLLGSIDSEGAHLLCQSAGRLLAG